MKKALDIFIAALNIGKRIMLTIFAGLFAFTALGAFISSIAAGGIICIIGAVVCSFCSAVCWSIRRN